MKNLKTMSYEEFGRLRFLDFFPKTSAYEVDDTGGIDYGAGYNGKEGYDMTLFARSSRTKGTTVISLELGVDCPETEGHALLDSLGLGLKKGMSYEQVLELLGKPEKDSRRFVRFVVGNKWPYYIGCSVNGGEGLFRVWIARKDLVDKVDQL